MLKIITSLTMFAIGLAAHAQVSETKEVSPFSKIEISNGVELILTESNTASIKAEAATTSVLETLVVNFRNNTLSISKNSSEPVRVYASANEIKAIKAGKGAIIKVTNQLSGKNVAVTVASGSIFTGSIVADNVSLMAESAAIINTRVKARSFAGNFTGKSKVNLSGTAKNAVINSDSDVICNARNFITDKVSVNANDGSSIAIFGGKSLRVSVTERGKVTYVGTPQKVTLLSEAATMRKIASNKRLLTEN